MCTNFYLAVEKLIEILQERLKNSLSDNDWVSNDLLDTTSTQTSNTEHKIYCCVHEIELAACYISFENRFIYNKTRRNWH